MKALSEIREGDATPEIKLIYSDIRRCLGLPLVNLIYRHLATLPGALPHTWGWVRDMAVSGQLDSALDRLTRQLPVPQIEVFELALLPQLTQVNHAAIKRVLDAYNRGNGLNLIALTAVKMGLHHQARGALKISRDASDDGVLPLPRLLTISELKPDVAKLVAKISRLHDSKGGVTPSLYLHLANWPEFLITVCNRIEPLLRNGSIERAREAAIELARVEAKGILAALPRAIETAGYPEQVLATLNRFVNQIIPAMLPVGLALDRAWTQCLEASAVPNRMLR